MKCAFGENPKRRYMTSRMSTRMTNAALIREALQKAALYMVKKEAAGDDVSKLPAFDQKSESLIPVLKGELPLKAHAHQANIHRHPHCMVHAKLIHSEHAGS